MLARTRLQTLPFAFVLIATSALAQDDRRGFHIGLSVGQSKVDIEAPRVGGAFVSSEANDETDTGFKLYGGYRFHRHFAVEGGWADLGSFRARRNVTVPASGSVTAEIEASGPYVDALGIIPLGQFALFGKVGAMYATTETRFSTTGAVVLAPGVARTTEDSEVEFKFGLGASFSFTQRFAIRAEYERFFDVGTSQTGEGDIDLMSVGIVLRF